MKYILITIIVIGLLINKSSAKLETNFYGGFKLDGQVYKEKADIKQLLKQAPQALDSYHKYLDLNNKGNAQLGGGLALVGFGVLMGVAGTTERDPSPVPLTIGIGATLSGLMLSVIGASKKSNATGYLNQIIPIFNGLLPKRSNTQDPVQICLNLGKHGLGLKLSW